jgi:hypothetical protein
MQDRRAEQGDLEQVSVVRQLCAERQSIAAIAHIVELTRQTVYRLLEEAPEAA